MSSQPCSQSRSGSPTEGHCPLLGLECAMTGPTLGLCLFVITSNQVWIIIISIVTNLNTSLARYVSMYWRLGS